MNNRQELKLIISSLMAGLLLVSSPIAAAESTTIIEEYKKVEEKNRDDQYPSDEQQKKTLESNLFRAMKTLLLRRIYEAKELEKVKGIKTSDVQYQREEKTFIYYVKIDKYFARMKYLTDPRIYIQDPIKVEYERQDGHVQLKHPD